MTATEPYRCSVPAKGVEVVTERTENGTYETIIHNGPLDGERFIARTRLGSMLQHKSALELARIAAESEPQTA